MTGLRLTWCRWREESRREEWPRGVIGQLHGNPSHVLLLLGSHPAPHISVDCLAVTAHSITPSSPPGAWYLSGWRSVICPGRGGQRHNGETVEICRHRAVAYERARQRHPHRWTRSSVAGVSRKRSGSTYRHQKSSQIQLR